MTPAELQALVPVLKNASDRYNRPVKRRPQGFAVKGAFEPGESAYAAGFPGCGGSVASGYIPTSRFAPDGTEEAAFRSSELGCRQDSDSEVRVSIEQQLDLADALLAQFKARSAAASSTEKTAERVYHHS